jgi:hypothetical protein
MADYTVAWRNHWANVSPEGSCPAILFEKIPSYLFCQFDRKLIDLGAAMKSFFDRPPKSWVES